MLKTWDLKRTPNYGSEHYNERQLTISAAALAKDGKTLMLTVPDLEPTWGLSIEYQLTGSNGRKFKGELHGSIRNLP